MTINILILGGTSESRELTLQLHELNLQEYCFETITSFAGLTTRPNIEAGKIKTGGFGGISGLIDYIRENEIDYLIDTTHPFARNMPWHAWEAAKITNCKILKLQRPAWDISKLKNITCFPSLEEMRKHIPIENKRIFFALGSQDIRHFKGLNTYKSFARMITHPSYSDLPQNCDILQTRPPYELEAEKSLFSDLQIDLIVAKNSGGTISFSKIQASQQLDIPVFLVERPKMPDTSIVTTVEETINWLLKDLKNANKT